jgi:hypothetical protein
LKAEFEVGHAQNSFDCAFSQLAGQREDIYGVIQPGSAAIASAACIARKVIPRVSPSVYCVQESLSITYIASIMYCTPLLHAITGPAWP